MEIFNESIETSALKIMEKRNVSRRMIIHGPLR